MSQIIFVKIQLEDLLQAPRDKGKVLNSRIESQIVMLLDGANSNTICTIDNYLLLHNTILLFALLVNIFCAASHD